MSAREKSVCEARMAESESLHLSIGVLGVSGGELEKTEKQLSDLTNIVLARDLNDYGWVFLPRR